MRLTWCAPPRSGQAGQNPQALKLLEVLPRETGTIGLGWGITGMRAVFATKDVTVPTDLKGMKLRINPTPVYRDFYQMLGAAPTPIPTPQVFDAMSNGQVDGLEADIEFSWNQRFDKVAKSLLQMNALFMPLCSAGLGPHLAGALMPATRNSSAAWWRSRWTRRSTTS